VADFADTTVLRYIFGVEPDLLLATSSGTVAAPAPAEQSTLSEPLQPPAAMPPPPAAGDPVPVRCAASTEEEEEVKPPILGFPEKFELALRYGEGRMAQDIEMSDSDRLCFDALAKQATLTLASMALALSLALGLARSLARSLALGLALGLALTRPALCLALTSFQPLF
jgi:hypothetical protein